MANIARPSAPQTRQLGLPPGRTPSPQLWLQLPAAPCSVDAAAAQQVQQVASCCLFCFKAKAAAARWFRLDVH